MSSPLESTPTPAATITDGSPKPEAPPLPQKVVAIGDAPPSALTEVNLHESTRPARHPADRDNNPSSNVNTTTNEDPKKSRPWTFGGISIRTLLQLFLLISLMAGTGVAWWYTVKRFQDIASQMTQDQRNNFGWSSAVFVHVAFSVIALLEVIFLERNIFRLRAERYMFKHGMLPDARRAAALGIAPWRRPPLPTYAAALAESGHGTGDVEDHLIAVVPPPAYGQTRGSMLLLSSTLPNNLVHGLRASQRANQPRSQEAEMEEGRRSRPLSYDASEEANDVARACELDITWARLENYSRSQQATSTTSPRY